MHSRFKHKKGLMNKRGLLFLYLGFFSFSFRTGTSFSRVFFALFVAAAAVFFFSFSFSFGSIFFWEGYSSYTYTVFIQWITA